MVSITFFVLVNYFVVCFSFRAFPLVIIFKRKNGKKESQKGAVRAE